MCLVIAMLRTAVVLGTASGVDSVDRFVVSITVIITTGIGELILSALHYRARREGLRALGCPSV
jgi:hypothetical protein